MGIHFLWGHTDSDHPADLLWAPVAIMFPMKAVPPVHSLPPQTTEIIGRGVTPKTHSGRDSARPPGPWPVAEASQSTASLHTELLTLGGTPEEAM